MRILSILIATTLLWPGSRAFAAGWLKITSPNFELFTTTNEKKGCEAILYFEQVRDLFLRIRPGSLVNPLPVRLIAFQNEKEYRRYRINEFAAAYYIGGDTRDYIVMGDIAADHFPVAVHEYTHLLIQHAGLKLPRWLDEGWADVNSTVHPEGSRVTIGSPIGGRLRTLSDTKWMSLESLFAVNHDSPEYNEKSKAGIFYAESWLLTHMLYLSDGYRPKFSQFLTKVIALNSSEAALREVYGKSPSEVRKDLEFYLSNGRVNIAVFEGKMTKPSEQPVSDAATDLEAGLVQADLLSHIRKTSEAKELYTGLIASNPKSWEAEQGLAYIAWRAQAIDEARRHFERAVDLGSNDGRAYFDYAQLLQGDRSNDERLKNVLVKALELRPDLADARLLLGFHCYNTRDYRCTIEQLDKVKRVTPERALSFFQVLAYSQLELGNRADARRQAERARPYAKTPEEIGKLDEFLRYLDRGPAAAASVSLEPDHAPSAKEAWLHAEGALQVIECLGSTIKLHVLVEGKKRSFLIADPSHVRTKKAEALDIVCGEQKGAPVIVEYTVNADASLKADGIVQSLEIR